MLIITITLFSHILFDVASKAMQHMPQRTLPRPIKACTGVSYHLKDALCSVLDSLFILVGSYLNCGEI